MAYARRLRRSAFVGMDRHTMVGMSQTDALTCLETQFIAHIDVERGLSKATVTAYTSDLDRYCAWLRKAGITEPASISRNHVEEYIAHLERAFQGPQSRLHP